MQTNNNGNQGRDSRDNQNDNRNTENPSNQNEQNMGNRGNHMDDDWGNSTQRGHESDGPRMRGRDINEDPDFGGSISSNAPEGNINAQASESGEFNGDDNMSDRERRDASEAQSRTFNEDEETWEEEKRMGSSNANRAVVKATTGTRMTKCSAARAVAEAKRTGMLHQVIITKGTGII